MAKDNLFDQDINLQGVSKIVNLRFEVLNGIAGTPIQTKQGGAYFDTNEKSLRLNIDDKHWFSTVLFNGTPADVNYLAVFTPGTINQIEKLEGPDDEDALVQVSYDGSVNLVEYGTINFLNYLDESIYVDSVINGDTRLVTSNAVYDYVQAAIASGTGDYLPLAGGVMSGDIELQDCGLVLSSIDTYPSVFITTGQGALVTSTLLQIYLPNSDSFVDIGNRDTLSTMRIAPDAIYAIASSGTTAVGTPDDPFTNGYITSLYVNTIQGSGTDSKLTLIGGASSTYTKIELGGDQVTVYDHLLPSVNMSKNLGGASMRWQYGYFNYLNGFRLTLSTGQTVIDISNTADIVEPASSSLLTESAIVSLFNTIKTIEGTDITDMSLVGMVTRYSGSNPEDYVLTADDNWVHKNSLNYWELELISGTTYKLKLNDSYDIASFEFFTNSTAVNNNLLFGVRSAISLLQLTYDGNRPHMYIGENDEGALVGNGSTVSIEVLSSMRITQSKSLYFGGTYLDTPLVSLSYLGKTISDVNYNALSISTAISTDATNIWGFLGTGASVPTPDSYVIVWVNGKYYKLSAEEYEPT